MNVAGYDHDEPMIYGKLAIDAHDAKIRAEALKDELRRLMAGDGDAAPPLGMDAVVSAVDAIMGIR